MLTEDSILSEEELKSSTNAKVCIGLIFFHAEYINRLNGKKLEKLQPMLDAEKTLPQYSCSSS
jgi:hypothetical protein